MPKVQFGGESNVSKPVKRMRWATQRHAGQSGVKKRLSILNRYSKTSFSPFEEKQPNASGDKTLTEASPMGQEVGADQELQSRTIFMNVPLPEDMKTEDGHNKQQFRRNKIRTAKYTPLSFIPKNLWFQFHNIANIYFFIIIILQVCYSRRWMGIFIDKKPDFSHFWSLKSRARLSAPNRHSRRDSHQRCHGRLAPDSA